MVGAAYRHLKRTAEAIEMLEAVHLHTQQMGLALDEVMILYQLTRAHIDADDWVRAEEITQHLLDIATVSSLKEFIIRGQWVHSLIDIFYERYDAAINILNSAQEFGGRY